MSRRRQRRAPPEPRPSVCIIGRPGCDVRCPPNESICDACMAAIDGEAALADLRRKLGKIKALQRQPVPPGFGPPGWRGP
jgi:hypothetical protein